MGRGTVLVFLVAALQVGAIFGQAPLAKKETRCTALYGRKLYNVCTASASLRSARAEPNADDPFADAIMNNAQALLDKARNMLGRTPSRPVFFSQKSVKNTAVKQLKEASHTIMVSSCVFRNAANVLDDAVDVLNHAILVMESQSEQQPDVSAPADPVDDVVSATPVSEQVTIDLSLMTNGKPVIANPIAEIAQQSDSEPPTPQNTNSQPPKPQNPNSQPPKPQNPNSQPPKPQNLNSQPPKPQNPNSQPPKPQNPNSQPPKPQNPNSQPPKPQNPNSQPLKPQNPNSQPSKPQNPESQPSKPQNPESQPSKPQNPKPQNNNSQPPKPQNSNSQPPKSQNHNSQSPKPQNDNDQPPKPQDNNTRPLDSQPSNSQPPNSQDPNSQSEEDIAGTNKLNFLNTKLHSLSTDVAVLLEKLGLALTTPHRSQAYLKLARAPLDVIQEIQLVLAKSEGAELEDEKEAVNIVEELQRHQLHLQRLVDVPDELTEKLKQPKDRNIAQALVTELKALKQTVIKVLPFPQDIY